MDIGALLLIFGIVLLSLSYILKPLRPQKINDPEKIIDYWVEQINPRTADEYEETNLYCPNCGEPVKESDRFCSSCGTKLEVRK
jgi:tRNA(Ile2) C34 agmatinyltransferase TiaS